MFKYVSAIFSASQKKFLLTFTSHSLIIALVIAVAGTGSSVFAGSKIEGDSLTGITSNILVNAFIEGEALAAGTGSVDAAGAAAQPSTTKPTSDDGIGTQVLNAGINVLFSLLTPFLILAGWLLSPDWVFGEVFGLRPVLYELWKLMSNIVYVAFAFLLIVMAFMNIYGGEKNAWAIKTKLPKLIIGVISVPFTWFFVSAIISITTLLTASTIQLAGDLSKNVPNATEFEFTVPKKCTLNFQGIVSGSGGSQGKFYDCPKGDDNKTKVPLSKLLQSDNPYGIVSYYAYAVFKIDTLKDVTGANLQSIKSLADISMNLLIALIVFVIFMLITGMLILALFMRAIHFWMIAIFSPLLSLKYFLEDKLSFGDKWLTVPKIISLAMVPVYVSAALAFGLVFISAIGGAKMQSYEGATVKIQGNSISAFGTEYKVEGKPTWIGNNVNEAANQSLSGNIFGQFIIYFLALGVLWIAVTAAVNSNEITKEAAQPVADFGNQIGGIIKKLPQYAPIIPTKHGHASIGSLRNVSSTIASAIESKQANTGTEIGRSIANSLGLASPLSDKHIRTGNYLRGMGNSTIPAGEKSVDTLKRFINQSQYQVEELGTSGAKENLRLLIDKINIGANEKAELKKKIDSLDGRDTSLNAFLDEFKKVAGQGYARDIDEAREWKELLKGAQNPGAAPASTQNSAAPATTPLTINNGSTPTTITIKRDKDGKISGIDDAAKTSLADQVSANPDSKKDIEKQLTDIIQKQNTPIREGEKILSEEQIKALVESILKPTQPKK